MLILFIQLLLLRITLCEETASFLSNVLTKIQRERLGLLDEEFESYNNDDNLASDSNDYFYINDSNDVSDDTFKDYQNADAEDPYHAQETKTKTHNRSASSLPTNDLIYIYNDTIYLYKAPNLTGHSKPGNHGVMNNDGKMKFGMIPYKMKMKPPGPPEGDGTVDMTNPEDLINIAFTEDEENQMAAAPPEGDAEDIEGYEYKYYPIDQLPPELASLVTNMGSKGRPPIKPGMLMKSPKKPGMPTKPGMPMKPGMMMKKKKRPVGPLFKAMAAFVGTAVMFIATILLLPRVKLVKAKSTGLNLLRMDDDDDENDKSWDLALR